MTMKIDIKGRQIDVGDALREHVAKALEAAFAKYAERPTGALVTLSKDKHEFLCECSVHLSTGMSALASGKAADPYAAFDKAEDRLAKQLRRYKRKLKNHHNIRTTPVSHTAGASFVIEAEQEPADADEAAVDAEALKPVIIAETETRIPTLSVGEAVLQMELGEEPVLMFRDERTESVSVVYRRADGNIGWIDSAPS